MSARESQGTTLFTALLALIGIGVVVQLWLLAVSVDALLRHERGTPVQAAIASFILFVINGLLVLYVFSFDRKIKQLRS
jgi:hypothetical protein